ncbi:MAG: radical SAM protein [Bacteroidales bacterium]|nr:radical SAM protein [Bacteroidales bacterium]
MKEKNIFLMLPFWDTLIPPTGISVLKSFLKQYGYDIRIVDANIDVKLKEYISLYFELLKKIIPKQKRGNFLNIGYDVLKNHMMAFINRKDEARYKNLIRKLIWRTYFTKLNDLQINEIDDYIKEYFEYFEKYIIDLIETEKPTTIGFSVYNDTFPSSLFAARIIKKRFSYITTLIGGSIFSDLTLNSPNFKFFLKKTEDIFDKIFIGESELLLLKYFRNEFLESKRVFTIKDLDGEVFPISDVKSPDFSDLDLSFYMLDSYEGSRSCYMQCEFCSETVYKGKYRTKNIKHVLDDLKEMYKTHKNQLFLMCDSLLNPIITELSVEIAKENTPVYFDGYLRVDKNGSYLENSFLWRKGGFYRARIGVESGSQKVLDLMNKKIKIDEIISAISSLAEAGVKTTTYWICGYPGETEEDFQMTLDLLERLSEDIYEADCCPFIYSYTGQSGSDSFIKNGKIGEVYDNYEKEMLLGQSYFLDTEPNREEIYSRVNRFIEHCKKLNIPNPYSLNEIIDADKRWKELHINAVPSYIDFEKENSVVKECRNKQIINKASNLFDTDWDFNLV